MPPLKPVLIHEAFIIPKPDEQHPRQKGMIHEPDCEAQHHLGRQAGELIITISVLRIRAQVYMGKASVGKK